MGKWEYLTIKFGSVNDQGQVSPVISNEELFTKQINWYADKGWELVSQFPVSENCAPYSGQTSAVFATSKRTVGEQSNA